MDQTARRAMVDEAISNPPQVHATQQALFAPGGVWKADRGLYLLLAEHCEPGSRTLETGMGVSTLLFARWGCKHTSVVPFQEEADRFVAHCEQHQVDLSDVSLIVEFSDTALPRLSGELDVVFIDGGHGFPAPVIDWYYAGQRLCDGGLLVVDDTGLPAVDRGLVKFLDADPRWVPVQSGPNWKAYRRNGTWDRREEWGTQTFFEQPASRRDQARSVIGRLRVRVGRARRRLMS